MAVTNYYSVNGVLLGEKSGAGSRVDYLSDALGSVTATVNNAAQVVNTYRYKPYGTQLAKTGAGSDPAFTWVGQRGYRQTSKKFSDVYVRARHYSSQTARWTTKDPLSFFDGPVAYIYVSSNPTKRTDPTGLSIRLTVSEKGHTEHNQNCGSGTFVVKFWGYGQVGWVIQHVRRRGDVKCCDNNKDGTKTCGKEKCNANFEDSDFWEAWEVKNGMLYAGFADTDIFHGGDRFTMPDQGASVCGTVSIEATVKFIPGYKLAIPPWSPPNGGSTGLAPTCCNVPNTTPPGWDEKDTQKHELHVKFDCCCKPYKTPTITTVP